MLSAAAVCVVIVVSGCSKRPEGILSESKMVDIMTDMQIAEALNQSRYGYLGSSSGTQSLGEGILAAHHVERAEFDSTLNWYGHNLDEYEKLYSKVDRRLEERERTYSRSAKKDKDAKEAENSDLWPYARHFMFTPDSESESLSFSLPVSDFKPGQQVEWKMRVPSGESMTALLGVEYEDDTASYTISTHSDQKKPMIITCFTDTGRVVTRIYGLLRPSEGPIIARIDSVTLKSLPLDSNSYYRLTYQRTYRLR